MEVRAELAELRGAAQGTSADARAGLEIGQAFADQGIPRVFARGDGGEDEVVREFRREILQAVDGEVGAAVEQGFLDLLGEEALGTDFSERDIRGLVAGGFDDFDAAFAAQGGQLGLHPVGLPEGELRTAGCDDEGGGHVSPGDGRPFG